MPDSYGLLLLLLIADYTALTVTWTGPAALVVRSVLFGLTVLLAFHTSRPRNGVQWVVRVAVALGVIAAVATAAHGGNTLTGGVVLYTSLLVLASPIVIGWRILHHPKVTPETILGGICVYVLIGMVFANFDYGLQLASGSSFFAQAGNHTPSDFAYFSYVTMSTVGYGDLTPALGLPRTLSVLEALSGQVVLVVLLARLVSRYQGPVGMRRQLEERLRGGDGASTADASET